jgi:hypothetical protein
MAQAPIAGSPAAQLSENLREAAAGGRLIQAHVRQLTLGEGVRKSFQLQESRPEASTGANCP